MTFFKRLFGGKPRDDVDQQRGVNPRNSEALDSEAIANAILASCSFKDEIPIFFDSAPPAISASFARLPIDDRRTVLKKVLREFHPDLDPNTLTKFMRELLDELPSADVQTAKCASCGEPAARFGATHARTCVCGKAYCQLCVMNAVGTPRQGRCLCGQSLTIR